MSQKRKEPKRRNRYHLLLNWATYRELKEDEIERYLNGEHIEGLYEEWIVMTEEEFEDYKVNHPNRDTIIKTLDINGVE